MTRLVAIVLLALVCAGCYTEIRQGTLWACDETLGCIDTGIGA